MEEGADAGVGSLFIVARSADLPGSASLVLASGVIDRHPVLVPPPLAQILHSLAAAEQFGRRPIGQHPVPASAARPAEHEQSLPPSMKDSPPTRPQSRSRNELAPPGPRACL